MKNNFSSTSETQAVLFQVKTITFSINTFHEIFSMNNKTKL